MAKGLRSKIKRSFRTAKRGNLAVAAPLTAAEDKRLQIMAGILKAGKRLQGDRDAERAMEEAANPLEPAPKSHGMDVDEDSRPVRLTRKVRNQLRKTKKKKSIITPLSGINQLHKKPKKGNKRNKKPLQ